MGTNQSLHSYVFPFRYLLKLATTVLTVLPTGPCIYIARNQQEAAVYLTRLLLLELSNTTPLQFSFQPERPHYVPKLLQRGL